MRTLAAIIVVLFTLTGAARAATLADLAAAMGADKVKTVTINGAGFYYHLGGSGLASEPWPKFNLKAYRLVANYQTASAALDLTLTQFLDPPRGAGFQPIRGELKRRSRISGATGWGINRRGRVRAARSTARTIHALWTTPFGVIKAAQASKAAVETRRVRGALFHTVAFAKPGAFKAVAWFDRNLLLRKVTARVANAVMGDMVSVTTYSGYKKISGIAFPSRMTLSYGGHPALDVVFHDVKFNLPADIKPPPGLKPRSGRVKASLVAPGVWFLTGGSHHSIAIEMADHVIVYEAPLSEARGAAVIKATRKAIPGKPIRQVINSHHHFDHSGGLRAFAAIGAEIVTHGSNLAFYGRAYGAPRTVKPDQLSSSGKTARFSAVGESLVLGDGTRRIELYTLTGSPHCESNMIAVLPKERILLVADAFSGRRLLKKPAGKGKVHPTRAHLWKTLVRLKLDGKIDTVLPIHGRKTDFRQVRWSAGVK